MSSLLRILAVAGLLLAPVGALAQAPSIPVPKPPSPKPVKPGGPGGLPGGDLSAPPPAVLVAMQLGKQLRDIREQALKEPALAEKEAAVRAIVEAHMVRLSPHADGAIRRLKALEKEIDAAKASNDREAQNRLLREARQHAGRLNALKDRSLGDATIRLIVEGFEKDVEAAMTKVDPRTPALLKKYQEASKEARAARQGGHGHGHDHGHGHKH
jgi:hypothetical protein